MPHLILYDGVCGLCNGLNQFVLKRDPSNKFRFASLQSPLAHRILKRYGRNADDLDTFYVIENYERESERLWDKARAGLFVLSEVGGLWRFFSLLQIIPTFILNFGYDLIAKSRYRIFGKFDSCLIPAPQYKEKFLG